MRFLPTVGVLVLLWSTSCAKSESPQKAPTLTLLYNVEEQPSEKNSVAQVLQSQLAAKGIQVKLDPTSNSVFYDRVGKGDFEAAFSLWYLDYEDPEGFLTDFYSKAGFRMSKFESAPYDRLYLDGLLAPTPTLRFSKFKDAADFVDRELPWIPLYANSEVFLLAQGADGFRANAYQYYDYRAVSLPAIHAASDVEVQTLDPALAYDLASKHLVTQSYEGLISMDEAGGIVPALAREWKFDASLKTLTFKLRSGLRFHGKASRPVVAADVKASYQRMLKGNSPYSYIFDYVKGAKEFKDGKAASVAGFETPDSATFRLVFTQPFPMMLPWMLAPATAVLPAGTPLDYDFSQGSIGTGPFVLSSWKAGVASFEGSTSYWGKDSTSRALPRAKSLTIRVMKDVNTQIAAFRQGELDVLSIPVAAFPEVFDSSGGIKPSWAGKQIREVKLNNLKFIAFNMKKTPWGTDPDLRRQAFDAIDRDAIVKRLLFGKGRPLRSILPPEMLLKGAK